MAQQHGTDHQRLASIGDQARENGHYEQAYQYYMKSVRTFQRHSARADRVLARTLCHMGMVLIQLNRPQDALLRLVEGTSYLSQIVHEQSPQDFSDCEALIAAYRHLAALHRQLDNAEAARDTMQVAVMTTRQILGPDHPITQSLLQDDPVEPSILRAPTVQRPPSSH